MTRTTLTRPGLARWLLVLAAVPAIVAGILTMHFLTGLSATGDHAHMTSATHASAEHATVDPAPLLADETCSTDCMPAHEMTGTACLMLALLVAFVFLPATGGSQWWLSPRAILARISVTVASLAPPHPPSLIVLSISRT